jgi:septal ring factor EnvC (AmiA/AmiB activator)
MADSQNKKKLHELDAKYIVALKRHVALYPQYKVFNDSPNIAKQFAENESELANVQADFFKFKNNVETNIISLANSSMRVDEEIVELKTQNKKLKQKLSSLKGYKEGAQGMFVDSQFLYRQFYIGNWILLLAMIGLGVVYQKNRASQGIY